MYVKVPLCLECPGIMWRDVIRRSPLWVSETFLQQQHPSLRDCRVGAPGAAGGRARRSSLSEMAFCQATGQCLHCSLTP